jgi:hypothetical protein
MMLKRKSSLSQRSPWSLLRAGVAGLLVAVGGAGATAGCLDRPVAPAVPKTSNIYVDEIRQTAVDKIDLLFMIDNSISMADKQAMLAAAVPELVGRLVTPICVDADDQPVGGNAIGGDCGGNGSPEFNPIKDIHVGIVTSSLGSHGATGTKDVCVDPSKDEHARLLGALRGLTTYQNAGFLKWDVTSPAKYTPPGESNAEAFGTAFTEMVVAAGEQGCGFEASLEAWYRFLIDPEPPAAVVKPVDPNTGEPGGLTVMEGIDQDVLAQRAAFLRPDSLVAIIMLSDENDCSIVDEQYGWLIARAAPMFRSTSACASNPNDNCCQSCGENQARPGCGPIDSDPQCQLGEFLGTGDDDLNLRCWQQKRRFGFELLHPIGRYVRGLREATVPNRAGADVPNPLFAAGPGTAPRDEALVFLAGIIGVPWQDIADEASLSGPGLRYLTFNEMSQATPNRWATILGEPTASPPVPPGDPLMVESVEPRSGMNPITMEPLAPADSMDPQDNRINGHEQANMGNKDLQYACIFPLEETLTCDEARFAADGGCDCFADDLKFNRPLCQPPGGGAPGITQHYAKAYPGLRHLQTLREFGENSVVASICPKVLDRSDPDYGYNPAVKAIIDRLKEALRGKCLPRALDIADQDFVENGEVRLQAGQVPCAVVEAVLQENNAGCQCDGNNGRLETRPELRTAVLKKLKENKTCDVEDDSPCEAYCTCEIEQFSGNDLMTCQNQRTPAKAGYCYINAAPNEPNVGDPDLVADCPADSKRLLNFGQNTPASGAIALVACLGASLGSQ